MWCSYNHNNQNILKSLSWANRYIRKQSIANIKEKKTEIPENVLKKLCPRGSAPGKFYGNTKIHKFLSNDMNNHPLRPIITNIRTVTYKEAKYLAKLLSQLTKSNYTIDSSKQFLN